MSTVKTILATFLFLLLPSSGLASLTFVASSTDRVNYGSATSLDNLKQSTMLFWVKPNNLQAHLGIWTKGGQSGVSPPFFSLNTPTANADEVRVRINQTVTASESVTTATNLTTNVWSFIGVIYDDSFVHRHRLYAGTLTASVTEQASSSFPGSGTKALTDQAQDWLVGNGSSTTAAWRGQIAFHAAWNRVLTLAEIKQQQFSPHVTSGTVIFSHLGFNGTASQTDISGTGNNGVVVGATVGPHVPIWDLW